MATPDVQSPVSSLPGSAMSTAPISATEQVHQQQAAQAIRLNGYVGFDSITKQIEHKLLKRGFQFNVMVVGQTGLGKSTLINTLFASHLLDSKGRQYVDEPVRQTTEIQTVKHRIVENGVALRLHITDTPGFGDQINNDGCWDPIVKYIKDQHSAYLRKELTANRDRHIEDTRIHCVLYFIRASGHSLKPIDVIVMKKLAEVANVVPVIAKADSLTIEERQHFKATIRRELSDIVEQQRHVNPNFSFYPFELDDQDDDERDLNRGIKSLIPFAVVGSERTVLVDGKSVRGRKTRWGVINVENEQHCDFIYLRNFLTRTHLQDLIETTSLIHYEAFRSRQLMALKESSSKSHQHSNPSNGA